MIVTVYDSDVRKKGLYEHFVSLLWTTMYNETGTFCLEMNADALAPGENVPGDYVCIDISPLSLMIVTAIELSKSKIVITGHTADFLLRTRVSDVTIRNKNAEEAMRQLVNDMRPIPHLTLGEIANIPDKFSAQTSDKSIYEYCNVIGQACDVGFRVRKSGKDLVFECYKPTLNTGAMFAAKYGNLTAERYSESVVQFANVAIVAGQGSGDSRVTVTVGDTDAEGLDRSEIYVDARNIQKEEDETDEEYLERLREHGREKLASCTKIKNTQFTAEDNLVQLGDVVQIRPTYSAERMTARVVSVSVKCQNNQIKRTIAVGTPITARK
jgi:hypothetical protein